MVGPDLVDLAVSHKLARLDSRLCEERAHRARGGTPNESDPGLPIGGSQ